MRRVADLEEAGAAVEDCWGGCNRSAARKRERRVTEGLASKEASKPTSHAGGGGPLEAPGELSTGPACPARGVSGNVPIGGGPMVTEMLGREGDSTAA